MLAQTDIGSVLLKMGENALETTEKLIFLNREINYMKESLEAIKARLDKLEAYKRIELLKEKGSG